MNLTKNMKLTLAGIFAVIIACGVGFSDRLFQSNAATELKKLDTLKNAIEITDTTTIPADYTFYPDIQKKSDGTQITKAEPFGDWDYTNTDTVEDDTEQPLQGIANIVWIDKNNSSYDGKLGVLYDNVGTYNGKTVSLRATYMGSSENATNNGFALIMYNNKLGIRSSLSHDAITIKYEFLDAETGEPITVKGYQQFTDLDYYQGLKLHNYDNIYYTSAALDTLKVANYDGYTDTIQTTISDNLIDDPTSKAKVAYTFTGSELSFTWTSGIRYYREVEGKTVTVAKPYKNLDKDASIIQALNTYYYVDGNGNICTSDTTGATRRSAVLTINASSDKIVPSEMKTPLKIISDKNGDEISKDTYSSTEKFYFTVIHEVPGETEEHYYTNYQMKDSLDTILNIDPSVKVFESGTKEDVSYKFDISINNNEVTATAKTKELAKKEFYAKSYELVIGATIKENSDVSDYIVDDVIQIPNKASVLVDNQNKDSNEVVVKVKDNPTLTIEKTSDKTNYNIGDVANYTVKVLQPVKNATAKNITITDTIQDTNVELIANSIVVKDMNNNIIDKAQITTNGNSYTIETNTNLDYNQYVTVSYRVKLENKELAGKEIVNTVTAKATNTDSVDTTNTIVIAVPVVYTPVLHIEKSVNKDILSFGDKATYTIKVSQSEGNAVAKNVVISDLFDTSLITLPSAKDIKVKDMDGNVLTNAKITVSNTGFTINTNSNLAKDEYFIVSYSATMNNEGLINTEIKNTATSVADNAAQVSDNVTVQVIKPILAIEKTANKDFFSLGDKISYTIKVSQTVENATAKNVVITDAFDTNLVTLPSSKNIKVKDMDGNTINADITITGTSVLIETHTDLAKGEFLTVTYTTLMENENVLGQTVTNTATAKADFVDEVSDSVSIGSVKPGLSIDKQIETEKQYYELGDKITYRLDVTQTEKNAIANNIVITDVFDTDLISMPSLKNIKVVDGDGNTLTDAEIKIKDSGFVIHTNANLAQNEHIYVTYSVIAENKDLIGKNVNNTATAKADNAEEVQDTEKIGVVKPVLSIEKTSDKDVYEINETATYTLKVMQMAENAVAKNVVIKDTFGKIKVSPENIVVKDMNGNVLDVTITKDENGFTIETNHDLAIDEFLTVSYTVPFTSEELINTKVDNTATASSENADEVTTRKEVSVVKPILETTKKSDSTTYSIGDTATYTLTVKQTVENAIAKNVVITDTFNTTLAKPENINVLDKDGHVVDAAEIKVNETGFVINTHTNLAKDEYFTVTYNVSLTNKELLGLDIQNKVVSTSDNTEPSEDDTTIHVYEPKLNTEKLTSKKYYSLGDTIAYTIKVSQTVENAIAKNVVIKDTFDTTFLTLPNAEDISIKDKDGNPVVGAEVTVNELGFTINTHSNLAKDEYFTISYSVIAGDKQLAETEVKNIAVSTSDNTDSSEDEVVVNIEKPELVIEKSSNKSSYGTDENATYIIKVTQKGENAVAKNVVIEDTLSNENAKILTDTIKIVDKDGNTLENANIKATEKGYTIETNANLATDEYFTITYSVDLKNNKLAGQTIMNTAIAKSSNTEDVFTKHEIKIVAPVLVIEKTSDQPIYLINSTAKYTVKVTQTTENAVAKNVIITDILENEKAKFLPDTLKIVDGNGKEVTDVTIQKSDNGYEIDTHRNLTYNQSFVITYNVELSDTALINTEVQNTAGAKADNASLVSTTYKVKVSDNAKEVQQELEKAGIDKVVTQTGDTTPIIPIVLVGILSILGIVIVVKRRK